MSLAVECCRASFCGARLNRADLPLATIDWSRFLRLARFHRIEGLVWNALSNCADSMPEAARYALAGHATAIAAHNLTAAADCRELLSRFQAERVPILFLKGLTVGALAYGNPALKAAIDIDLLVDPADLAKAAGLLRQCGYRLTTPRESAADAILHAWHRSWKESVWMKSAPRLQIDLHTRVADQRQLLPNLDVHSPRQLVTVGNDIQLPTFANDELFAYLAVHGASSAWFRLKWISDFAALLDAVSAERLDQLFRTSQMLGAGRAAGQALLLSDALFGTLQANVELRQELERDRATRRLTRAALKFVTGEPNEPTARRFGTLTIHWTQFLLLPGARFRFSELLRQVNRPFVRARS